MIGDGIFQQRIKVDGDPIGVGRYFNVNRLNVLGITRPGQGRVPGTNPKRRELLNRTGRSVFARNPTRISECECAGPHLDVAQKRFAARLAFRRPPATWEERRRRARLHSLRWQSIASSATTRLRGWSIVIMHVLQSVLIGGSSSDRAMNGFVRSPARPRHS